MTKTNERIKCAVSGVTYNGRLMRKCKHPAVIKKYGNGEAKIDVSHYVCAKCDFAQHAEFTSALSCGYTV